MVKEKYLDSKFFCPSEKAEKIPMDSYRDSPFSITKDAWLIIFQKNYSFVYLTLR